MLSLVWFLLHAGPLPDVSTILPKDKHGQSVGDYILGLPVPRGSTLVARMDLTVYVRAPYSPDEVVRFYRRYLGKAWGDAEETEAGLRFGRKDSPYTAVIVVADGDFSSVSFVPNPKAKPVLKTPDRQLFGVMVPADARNVGESPSSVSFDIAKPLSEVIAHYDNLYSAHPKVETTIGAAGHLLLHTKDPSLPFSSLHIHQASDQLYLKPSEWTTVSALK